MYQYQLPEELDKVSQQQADTFRIVVAQELEALDTVISETELKRRGKFYMDADQRQRGYDELYRHGFGKTVVIDTELEGRLNFRVSQATSDYANTQLGFATPNSPLGKLCRIAKLGMSLESPKWGEYTVVEIRNFARYGGKEAVEHIRNFRVMESQSLALGQEGEVFYATVSNLRASLGRWFANGELPQAEHISSGLLVAIESSADQHAPLADIELDFDEPVILLEDEPQPSNRYDVFGRSEQEQDDYYGLSNYFFLNPTDEQLEIMTNSAGMGPMLVEGVAGSGKTCAALGRAKTLCDLAHSPDDEQFNTDFMADSCVGFVRTGELVKYLRASCLELDIGQLPVEEYASLVYGLSQSRDLLIKRRPSAGLASDGETQEEAEHFEGGPTQQLGEMSKTKYHNLAVAPSYDISNETRMPWLQTMCEVIGWRVANDLQHQLTSLNLPENIKQDAFISKVGNGETLLALLKDRLETLYQPLLAQLRGRSAASFTLDRVISQILQVQNKLALEFFNKDSKWVSFATGEWQQVRDARHGVSLLRERGAVLVGFDKRDKKWAEVFVEVKADLLNLFKQGATLYASSNEQPLQVADLDSIWSRVQTGGQPLYCCIPGMPQLPIKLARDFDDINIRLINEKHGYYKLFSCAGAQRRNVIELNPYCRQIQQGQKPTSLERLFKEQLRRIYRKWQFADLYHDALLTPYQDDKQKAAACLAGVDHWQQVAERLKARQLAEHDKDLLLALAHIMTRDLPLDAPVPSHLAETSYCRSVFIDEVQDFTEQQIFLMAEQADPKYHSVTLVGDMHQQLGRGNVRNIEACFPFRPLTSYLLKENKRQERAPQLAATAMLFRALVQQDERLTDTKRIDKWRQDSSQGDSRLFHDIFFEDLDEKLLEVIECQPHGRTIAVICPEESMATSLEARLHEPLATRTNRTSHVANSIDLAKKYMVHFSCAEHVKGLEFDTLIYAGMEYIDWRDVHQLNKTYVTLSRPRKQLVMFGDSTRLPAVVRDCLVSVCESAAH
ncbi:hypothetical protein [Aeromonas veronii]|uniref:hypothetical protein n=1 Tax=Aeromonas veronii TaxID=654 RepID=UPI001D0A5F24|nr:hypothetical protein [Aeromonas veronii]MCC0088597.1 hypothetical protein [Aeromonas veronii]MCF5893527.1 hypothetical protein [Aeromonas veronii]